MSAHVFWTVLALLAVLEAVGILFAVSLCRMAAQGDYAASERRTEEVS